MKILKDNTTQKLNGKENTKKINTYPRKKVCEQCLSELEYEENDLRMGALGCIYIDCPCCGYENMLEENENSITLTKDNIEFTTHFFHTSKESGAVNSCNNEEVKKCIEKAINYFRSNKDEFVWFSEYGNLYVVVYKYSGDEEYYVTVTNNYYSTHIPFENEDY